MVVPGARSAIESLYTDVCTIRVQRDAEPEPYALPSAIKRTGAAVLVEGQPCRLSYDSLSVSEGDPAAAVAQAVKLLLSPDIAVPAGCEVTVTRQGRTLEFSGSGLPAVYPTHQEIPLVPKGRYA